MKLSEIPTLNSTRLVEIGCHFGENFNVPGPDDGLVSISSIESKSYFKSLGRTLDNHMDLLGPQEYGIARGILMGN